MKKVGVFLQIYEKEFDIIYLLFKMMVAFFVSKVAPMRSKRKAVNIYELQLYCLHLFFGDLYR